MLFVDYGNSEVVEKDDLCHIPLEFLELPRQSLCCMLDGLQIQPSSEEMQVIFEGKSIPLLVKPLSKLSLYYLLVI